MPHHSGRGKCCRSAEGGTALYTARELGYQLNDAGAEIIHERASRNERQESFAVGIFPPLKREAVAPTRSGRLGFFYSEVGRVVLHCLSDRLRGVVFLWAMRSCCQAAISLASQPLARGPSFIGFGTFCPL